MSWGKRFLAWWRSIDWGDVLRDAHCYGGIALASGGVAAVSFALTGAALVGAGTGAVVAGLALFWLSVRKVARGGSTPNP